MKYTKINRSFRGVTFVRMLSLCVQDIVWQQLKGTQNRQYGPEKVWISVSEKVNLLDDVPMSVVDDLGPE